jgi:hypothetical protein
MRKRTIVLTSKSLLALPQKKDFTANIVTLWPLQCAPYIDAAPVWEQNNLDLFLIPLHTAYKLRSKIYAASERKIMWS